ncbi:hypothetical protein FA95DRAFT_503632 [Auriscalpium vulgare]|uniref:Uncharacterized protein n=1 Tax=Auriscalpium vulgare TaxID=40419 RepID=A0ACB8RHM0_9AGAM|nr:hypothetical protein FA95DRAFT_503632 [Auriscalpium vulgare]
MTGSSQLSCKPVDGSMWATFSSSFVFAWPVSRASQPPPTRDADNTHRFHSHTALRAARGASAVRRGRGHGGHRVDLWCGAGGDEAREDADGNGEGREGGEGGKHCESDGGWVLGGWGLGQRG